MCRIRALLTIVCLGLILVAVPGTQAAPTAPDTIVLTPNWHFETDQPTDSFRRLTVASGCDVNGDGYEDVLVGDRAYPYAVSSGRAWLYYGGPSGLSASPARVFDPPVVESSGAFGEDVYCDLDVNGDGFDDILISMDNYNNATYSDAGAVFVWYGHPGGPAGSYDWKAQGNETYAHFGISLDSAGDVNGDNYDDIIVAGWTYDTATNAYVYYGGPDGLGPTGTPSNADWKATIGVYRGNLARGIGDVNGDGWDDVMLGVHTYDGGITDQGVVYAWYGSAGGLGDSGTAGNADWSATSGQASAYLGWAGDGIGDLNGDGYDDLAVGAYGYDNGETNEGAVFVWYGSVSGLGPTGNPGNADWRAESNVGSSFGFSLRPAGDVNGDGYADLVAGAPGYPAPSGGAWFVWLGAPAGLGDPGTPANADVAGYGDQAGGGLGRDEVAAGDVNGDGYDDIFATAYMYDMGQIDEGVVFGYYSTFRRLLLPLILRNYP